MKGQTYSTSLFATLITHLTDAHFQLAQDLKNLDTITQVTTGLRLSESVFHLVPSYWPNYELPQVLTATIIFVVMMPATHTSGSK